MDVEIKGKGDPDTYGCEHRDVDLIVPSKKNVMKATTHLLVTGSLDHESNSHYRGHDCLTKHRGHDGGTWASNRGRVELLERSLFGQVDGVRGASRESLSRIPDLQRHCESPRVIMRLWIFFPAMPLDVGALHMRGVASQVSGERRSLR